MKHEVRLAAAAFAAMMGFAANGAEIRVVSSIGMKAVIDEARPLFEYATGHKLILVYGVAGPLHRQLENGEAFDVVILTSAMTNDLAARGRVVPVSVVDVAKTTLGLAARKGAAKADIATPEALKQALLGAKSIARSKEGQSGVQAAKLIERLGVERELESRMILDTRPGGAVMAVSEGKAELAFALVSEIVPIPEVDFLGPVPDELQSYTVFTAGISRGSTEPEAAKTFVRFLLSEAVATIRKAKGMERVTFITLERNPDAK